MKLALLLCAVVVISGGITGCVTTGMVPVGSLRQPLGTYLTLEGKRAEGLKMGVCTLIVEKINGIPIDEPITIWVDNLDLPANELCIIKGYESVRMIGTPRAYVEAMKEMGEEATMPQAGFSAQCYFVALRTIAPEGLKISK